jgi:hypothetical protein
MDLESVLVYKHDQFLFNFAASLPSARRGRWLPGHRGWVFGPHAWLEDPNYDIVDLPSGRPIDRQQLSHTSNPFWERQGLAVASYPSSTATLAPEASALLHGLRVGLVREQTRLIHAAIEWLHTFLSGRTTGQQKLLNQPYVAYQLASIVRDAHALTSTTLDTCVSSSGARQWLIDEIDSIGTRLIALSGGRAMLRGQMVYLHTLFVTLGRLYLEDR